MAQSLSKAFLHLVFSTKDRKKLILPKMENSLYSYISQVCSTVKCPLHQIGGMEDHIHVLVEISRGISIAKLAESIKSNSSRWIKTEFPQMSDFSWQNGYGAFSVDLSTYDAVKSYIANQKIHHQKWGFKEEFLKLLKRYQVDYDERYVWN